MSSSSLPAMFQHEGSSPVGATSGAHVGTGPRSYTSGEAMPVIKTCGGACEKHWHVPWQAFICGTTEAILA